MIKQTYLKKIEYWEIPVEWKIMGRISVPKFEATTAEEALEVGKSMLETCQIPENDEFLEKSVKINEGLFIMQESMFENTGCKKAVYKNGEEFWKDLLYNYGEREALVKASHYLETPLPNSNPNSADFLKESQFRRELLFAIFGMSSLVGEEKATESRAHIYGHFTLIEEEK